MTTMDATARGWLVNTAKANHWRVAEWYDVTDLIQDGFACWARVVRKYEEETGRIRSRSHIMALFKRAYLNDIHDMAKARTRCTEDRILDCARGTRPLLHSSERDAWDHMLEDDGDSFQYERMIAEAPPVLRPLLQCLLSEGESLTLRAAYRVNRHGERETLNQRLCRLIGADPNRYDYATALRSYLTI